MKKVFLFVHNEGVEKRQYLADILDRMPEVIAWRYDMISCFYIVSESSAKTLAERIRAETGGTLERMIVTAITTDYWGWATQDTWYLVANKAPKPLPPQGP